MAETIIIPKETDQQPLQAMIEQNPSIGKMLVELRSAAKQVSPVELKYILNKAGLVNESTYFSFEEFVSFVLSEHEDMCEIYDLHKEWIHLVEVEHPHDNIVIFGPVDSWKTTFLAVIYPLYLMYLTQGLVRIGLFSDAEKLSKKRIVQARTVIENNSKLNSIGVRKPVRAHDWGETSFTVERPPERAISGSTMMAFGIGGQSQGHKFDVIILDDVVCQDNSSTEAKRKYIETKFRREVISRLTKRPPPPLKKTRAISICTAFNKEDLNHKLGRGFDEGNVPTFVEKRYKAIYEQEDIDEAPEFIKKQLREKRFLVKDADTNEIRPIGLAFPKILPYKYLMKMKREQGAKFFAQNYQQIPLSDEDYTIPPEWITACFKPDLIMGPDLWFRGFSGKGFVLFFVFDTAIVRSKKEAEKRDTDFWVMEARAYSQKLDLRVIIDYRRGRGARKTELLNTAIDFYNTFLLSKDTNRIVAGAPADIVPCWYIEDNIAQDYLVQDMEDIFGKSHVRGLRTTHISKNDGFIGLPAVSYAYERGAVMIPTGDARSQAFAKVLLEEATNYGQGIGHDDVFMCELINEQAIGKLRHVIKPLDSNLLGVKKRGARNFGRIPPPRLRQRQVMRR